MDISDLHYFTAAADAGSFPSAGKALGRNPSMLSRRIGGLDDELGLPLFERRHGGILLTSGGAVAGVVGIEGGVVSEVINLESSGVEAPDRRPRHDQHYHEDRFLAA